MSSHAEKMAAEWRAEAQRLRYEHEYFCRVAGQRLDESNEADRQAEAWQAVVDERSRELTDLGGAL
jgi:hypothetical protein